MFDPSLFDDKAVMDAQARMESARSGFDNLRIELADLVLPMQSGFHNRSQTQGYSQTNVQYDEYAAQALQDGVSTFEGLTMPRGQKWQGIRAAREQLNDTVANVQWFEAKAALVFSMRNDPKSGFTNAVHSSSESLFGFGEQSLWVDKRFDPWGRFEGLSYQSEHIDGIFVERDAAGQILRVHRKFTLSAEAAAREFGEDTPKEVRDALKGQTPNPAKKFEFIHVIERNGSPLQGRIDARGMPWKAGYYSFADKAMFRTGGYRTLRRIVSTFSRSHYEDYGRGPAGLVLPAIRASQVIMQDRVLAAEYATKGSWVAMDDDLDQSVIALGPDGVIWGGLDEMGRDRIKQLMRNIDPQAGAQLHAEIRQVIDRAFYRDLMQLNRELKTHISAARTMEEVSEKGILLSPLARQEQEWFAPMLDGELDLLWEEGFLDDMPPEIAEYFAGGGGIRVVYDNNLARMQEASEAAGYLRTAEQVGSIAQFDPSAVQSFTREYPLSKVIPGLGDVNGIPAKWRATDEEKTARDEQEAQQAQLQQILQAAPVLAESAKSVAEAGAISGA